MVTDTEWPDVADLDMDAAPDPWDRRPGEPSKAYGAFRLFRDFPPYQRTLQAVAAQTGLTDRRCRQLCVAHDWHERAEAWDDACHKLEDHERLEALRIMHETHRKAGRLAVVKAVQALNNIEPETLNPAQIVRMLELGAKLERSTLIVSVEELQGFEPMDDDEDDPWDIIARELDPATASEL
jgi:hypothetical protein